MAGAPTIGALFAQRVVIGVGDMAVSNNSIVTLSTYALGSCVGVIAYDPAELGRAAAELLFSRMAGDARPPQRIVIPTRLVQRGSGEISA